MTIKERDTGQQLQPNFYYWVESLTLESNGGHTKARIHNAISLKKSKLNCKFREAQ